MEYYAYLLQSHVQIIILNIFHISNFRILFHVLIIIVTNNKDDLLIENIFFIAQNIFITQNTFKYFFLFRKYSLII